MVSIESLRVHAIAHTFPEPTTLRRAIARLGFVQADPIRSPARAQDLILRQRVRTYQAGDLERRYASLGIEEDGLYAYGFVPRRVWELIHPRNTAELSAIEKKVFAAVRRSGEIHPRELEAHLGRERVINAWGGYSKATTHALDSLHWRGLLRITRRDNGIRVYDLAVPPAELLPPEERLRQLILINARILAPVPEQTLHANIAKLRRLGNTRATFADLVRTGELLKETVDGLSYVWPAGRMPKPEVPRTVRFLAPFDPLVWDRRRFEHLWGWAYRFEAYTPVAKRVRGYYAMPLLWCDKVIGWANASVALGRLTVDIGFVGNRPREKDFRLELDAEIARLESFLLRDTTPAIPLQD